MKKSNILFSGLINVVGESDTGKTTFALGCGAPPDRIVFIDDDVKGQALATEFEKKGKPFGMFVNLTKDTERMKEIKFHRHCLDVIDSIPVGRFDVIIWDTFTRFEKSFHPWVLTHQKDFKDHWSPMGVIHGAEIWIAAQQYEATILDKLQQKAPLVILTSHMKNENVGGIRTGKRIPQCMKPLIIKSIMRVLLRHSDDGAPAPTGLVLKRIGKRTINEDGIQTTCILPRKIKDFTWKTVREFWKNPVGNRTPTQDELPNAFETSLLDSTMLTDDQRLVMKLALQGATNAEEEESGVATMRAQMKEMRDEGVSIGDIAKEFEMSVKETIEFLNK